MSETIFDLVPLSKFRTIYHMNKNGDKELGGGTPHMRRIIGYQLALTEAMYRREKQRADELQRCCDQLDELLDRMNGDF